MLRADLPTAHGISDQIDQINAALVILAAPSPVITVAVSGGGPGAAQIILPLNPANLTTMLNNRLTNLQNQLTALGVT